MSETCTHNCETCKEDCSENKTIKKEVAMGNVKRVIGIVSGKGGVGKSLVTSLLAVETKKRGKNTAVLDADITGPSIPKAFGLKEKAEGDEEGVFPVETRSGIKCMSINLLLEDETQPVVWRGPIIAGTVKQFYTDVHWGDLDCMYIDMPPGTGDVPLTVFESIPVDGIIIVTMPQTLVSMIVQKAVKMAHMLNIPVLAIVENQSYYECPDCGKRVELFGKSGLEEIMINNGIMLSAKLPINPEFARLSDAGDIESADTGAVSKIVDAILNKKA
ncbi:MAG: Mrp/NBP35 family ATP-binding protein [Clostridia bacterium]